MASLVNNSTFEYNSLKEYGSIICGTRGAETEKYWYHQDIRGSTTAIVGANGNLQKGYTYDEFGSIEESGNVSFLNEVTFTGSVTDTSTGLQYMNSRYYDSSTGRFLTQDSYSGSPYDPWTQHLYSYCGNNPVNMVDPTGHFCISAIIIGAIVGAVIGAGIVGYQDYKDDGEVFNGSKTVGDYALGVAIGGAAGAAVGAAVGAVGAAGGVGAAAKAAGAGIKSAATWVGSKATAAATWVGSKATAAGTTIATQGKKIVEGAKHAGTKLVEGAKHVYNTVSGTYNKLAQSGTVNNQYNKVTLGKYQGNALTSYQKVAESNHSTYFQLNNWDAIKSRVGESNMWNINKSFLQQQYNAGKEFLLSHNPSSANAGSYFAKEVEWMTNKGFSFIEDSGIWRAIKK